MYGRKGFKFDIHKYVGGSIKYISSLNLIKYEHASSGIWSEYGCWHYIIVFLLYLLSIGICACLFVRVRFICTQRSILLHLIVISLTETDLIVEPDISHCIKTKLFSSTSRWKREKVSETRRILRKI